MLQFFGSVPLSGQGVPIPMAVKAVRKMVNKLYRRWKDHRVTVMRICLEMK
jgi:hypothetical protein